MVTMSQQYCRVPSSKRLRITTQKVLLKIIEKFSRKKTTALLSSEGISAYVRLKKNSFSEQLNKFKAIESYLPLHSIHTSAKVRVYPLWI